MYLSGAIGDSAGIPNINAATEVMVGQAVTVVGRTNGNEVTNGVLSISATVASIDEGTGYLKLGQDLTNPGDSGGGVYLDRETVIAVVTGGTGTQDVDSMSALDAWSVSAVNDCNSVRFPQSCFVTFFSDQPPPGGGCSVAGSQVLLRRSAHWPWLLVAFSMVSLTVAARLRERRRAARGASESVCSARRKSAA